MKNNKALFSDAFSCAVLNEMPDMVRVINSDGKVIFSSGTKKDVSDENLETCYKMPGAAAYCEDCIAIRCIEKERRYTKISRVKGKVYSVSANPVSFDGEVYALEIFSDITKESNLKDKLISANTRMMDDLEIARSLQLSILRHNLPKVQGYNFCAEFLPCEALGGDMYDCFSMRDGRVVMYIADVSGHGVMPAMLTVYLRQEMFAQCKDPDITPEKVLKKIQVSFEELNTEESIYITIFVVILTPSSGEFVCANAGHSVPPLIVGKNGVREIFLPGTPICRWVDKVGHKEIKGVISKGEKLFLYTDGLDGIHIGQKSSKKLNGILLRDKLSGKKLLNEIKKEFTQTKADDVTMLLCERKI